MEVEYLRVGGAVVGYAGTVFADSCDGRVVVGFRLVGPASRALYTVGVPAVIPMYSDVAGNGPVECTFTVTVNDTEDLNISSCQADLVDVNDLGVFGAVVSYTEPVFADNCDGPVLVGTRTLGPASGPLVPVGVTTVTHQYSDVAGNGPV